MKWAKSEWVNSHVCLCFMLGFTSDIKLISYILNIYIHHLSVYLILIALLFLMPQRLLLALNGHSTNNAILLVRPKSCFLPSRTPASHHPPQCAWIYDSFTNSASSQTISCSSPVSSFATLADNVPPITASVNATA